MQELDPSNAPPKLPFYQRWHHSHHVPVIPSLVSSQGLLQQASLWSSSTRREGRHIMQFKLPWNINTESCSDMRWYRAQLDHAEQHGLTTSFSIVQHRRTLDSPFFHEYLLVLLSDGSCYRIERTGVGSRVTAVMNTGCEAWDIIEWIPADQFESHASAESSSLIVEVQFPRTFELLDVLAVCYAIRQHPRAKRYTLQVYNCYFFCYTVLSILARRLVFFGLHVSETGDSEQLEQALHRMRELCTCPLSDKAKQYFAIRLCSAIHPENQYPGLELAELLVSLARVGHAPGALNASLRDVFWLSRGARKVKDGALYYFRHPLLDMLRRLVDSVPLRSPQEDTDSYKAMERSFYRELGAAIQHGNAALRQEAESALRKRYGVSLPKKLAAYLIGAPFGFVEGSCDGWFQVHGRGLVRLKYALCCGRSAANLGYLIILQGGFNFKVNNHSDDFDTWNAWSDKLFASDHTLTFFLGGAPFQDLIGLLFASDRLFILESAVFLLADTLFAPLITEAVSPSKLIGLVQMGEDKVQSRVNILEFQDHIRQHIKKYADRVERHRLDSSILISLDVEREIEEVWRRLPFGFGPRA